MSGHARTALVLIAVSLLSLVVHAVGGTGTRYFTDDYCIRQEAYTADPLALTATWYQTSGGRLAQYLSMAVLFRADTGLVPVLPALLLLLWGLGMGWLSIEIAHTLRLPITLGLAVGLFLQAAVVAGAPNLVQALYWMTGILTYPIPVVVAAFAGALSVRIVRHGMTFVQAAVLFVLVLTAGLFNEPFAFMQAALIGAGLLITFVAARSNRSLWQCTGVALAAAVCALVLLVIAPGNSVRQSSFEGGESFITAVFNAAVYAVGFSLGAVVFNPFGTVAAFFAGMAVPGLLNRFSTPSGKPPLTMTHPQARWSLAAAMVLWLGLCAAFMLPGFYATGSPPPARSFMMPLSFYLPTCIVLGVLVRLSLRIRERSAGGFNRWMALTAGIVIFAHGVWATAQAVPTAAYALDYGREWDVRTRELADANPDDTFLWTPLPHDLAIFTGLESITADPDHWVNRCAASFYTVASIVTPGSDDP